VQDVFKVAYSSEEANDTEAGKAEEGKGKAKVVDVVSSQGPEHSRTLRDILNYINAQFAESDASNSYRQPHFKVCRHSCRP
jgi:hypothetical protein